MRIPSLLLAAAALLGAPPAAPAQAPAPDPGRTVQRSRAHEFTATVRGVDPATRMVTLQGQDGGFFTLRAGEHVKNLARVKAGDVVRIGYYDTVVVRVTKPGGAAPAATPTPATRATAGAPAGEAPRGVTTRDETVVATVQAIAADGSSVTLRGKDGDRVLPVADRRNLEGVHVGDQVVITITQALAISVEEAPAAPPPAAAPGAAPPAR